MLSLINSRSRSTIAPRIDAYYLSFPDSVSLPWYQNGATPHDVRLNILNVGRHVIEEKYILGSNS
jgi:hypothetical protein